MSEIEKRYYTEKEFAAIVGWHKESIADMRRAGERKCVDPQCEGCSPYPKDLMLSHYCAKPNHELQRWKWK